MMEIRDLFITPLLLLLVYAGAYAIRPYLTDRVNVRYFIPGLTAKIVGALAVGFIYQFYYGRGDTFTYFHLGSKYVWEAFKDSPALAFKLIFAGSEYTNDTFQYASKIYTYGDSSSYFVVRIAGLFDILTLHTYSATAVLFALVCFGGMWAMFKVFYQLFPAQHLGMAIAILFVPSVFFWGSGLLKDTITIGALGWATYCIYSIFILRRSIVLCSIILLISFYTIYTVKIYILLCFLPAAILWIMYTKMHQVRNVVLKVMIAPFLLTLTGVLGYFSIVKVGEDNPRYNVENIASTAKVTAEWLHYVSEMQGGSAYTLGDYDYSPVGMVKKFPRAVWVSLYRPYLWEVHNVVMLLSALESLALLLFTGYVFFKVGFGRAIALITSSPILIFCFLFSIIFAFAVGISTYNFGSLVRYKIPLYPFFVSGLFILLSYAKSKRKFEALELTE
ncbi:MAG: hypothetical protein HC819_20600 [Cyclobacteriaceae bacterium]|nr:hypothetical protein [Cyclobacteriaceae bacterium]